MRNTVSYFFSEPMRARGYYSSSWYYASLTVLSEKIFKWQIFFRVEIFNFLELLRW